MFIGPQAETYTWHRARQGGFISAGDNLHRVEIDGRQMRLSPRWSEIAQDAVQQGSSFKATYRDLVFFPALERAYPNLLGLPVTVSGVSEANSEIAGLVDNSLLTTLYADKLTDTAFTTDVVYHELQHVVQAIEGFSAGSSTRFEFGKLAQRWLDTLSTGCRTLLGSRYDDVSLELSASADLRKYRDFCGKLVLQPEAFYKGDVEAQVDDPFLQNFLRSLRKYAGQNYLGTAGEVEARESAARRSYFPQDRLERRPAHAALSPSATNAWNMCLNAANDNGPLVKFEPRPRDLCEELILAEYDLVRRPELRPGFGQIRMGTARPVKPGVPVVLPL